jgi:hypothetical protein
MELMRFQPKMRTRFSTLVLTVSWRRWTSCSTNSSPQGAPRDHRIGEVGSGHSAVDVEEGKDAFTLRAELRG